MRLQTRLPTGCIIPNDFGKRGVRLSDGLAGSGVIGAEAPIGRSFFSNQRFKLIWLSCTQTRPHAPQVGFLAEALPRTRQALNRSPLVLQPQIAADKG